MPTRTTIVWLLTTALWAGGAAQAQVSDPIPQPVTTRGLSVEIRDLARLPDTQDMHPINDESPSGYARLSFVRDAPDGRRFANDSRGLLYLLGDNSESSVYLNIAEVFPHAFYDSLQSGFIGFAFHPQFADSGLLYTVHAETAAGNPAQPHFIPPGFGPGNVNYHSVITEWQAADPAAAAFEGDRREVLRVGHVVELFRHPLGYLGFNPTAEPGDADYGLLYTGGNDLGFSNGGGPNAEDPAQLQRLDTVAGNIIRIDPRSPSESGGEPGAGDYTIPAVNQFAADNDPATLGEIYAQGFRNAHRLSWDMTDGTLFASDVGMSHVEEINIVHEGRNYGWMQREGFFDNGTSVADGAMREVHALPVDILTGSTQDGFTYPVAVYDHGEGQAVTAGFAYRGPIPALQGKFVFGELVRGRLFAADVDAMKAADDGIPGTVAPVEEIQLFVRDAAGNRTDVTLWELIEATLGTTITRADLHISQGRNGEIFITSRQDGMIRVLAGG